MTEVKVNKWALKYYRPLTNEVMLAIMDEVKAHIAGSGNKTVLSSRDEAYALASRFDGVLYRPFFKQRPMRILGAIIDRCGEAHNEKVLERLYIGKEFIDQWGQVFKIPPEDVIKEYITPLLRLHILKPSDRPEYLYRVGMEFFHLVGPLAQFRAALVDPEKYREMRAVVNGILSIYVVAHAVKSKIHGESARIPWFLRLSMLYTLSGLEPRVAQIRIRDILELERINYVDKYFVHEKGLPVELWRSIREEAFEFMDRNKVIEDVTSEGYKLNDIWIRMHEEGVRRYVQRLLRRYRGF
ncbi:MAG: hypothetical protein DSO07_09095 [Thermoproteota archaeon]|jgi:hypothetical protein|uniref:Uncharacterized protein n=1 Tax=Candidatus Methanodesulfokora washburnensis TaxID=2478471 RepID=A0A3R9X772_9CREN|nr:hypothetical protein [Candidatus Methanodesulfokores washburnensis]RSN76956.1 hypothetical protein D6D85_03160 [Candidatus Methanodesulfokores washburnensis]RZN61259.1 MAG: hypothetical protein EF810_05090 [Candidatus Methanodesulfokores washburnensis]TDA40462.1 MAG: hypothetical protein DSO07_09095 [Candidatus Korarchaeota archaeon]